MSKVLSEGQRAYEARRATRAGMSLERWLESKEKQQAAEARTREREKEREAAAAKPLKKPGLFGRLLERAQKPL
jgi:hypothetical protein